MVVWNGLEGGVGWVGKRNSLEDMVAGPGIYQGHLQIGGGEPSGTTEVGVSALWSHWFPSQLRPLAVTQVVVDRLTGQGVSGWRHLRRSSSQRKG